MQGKEILISGDIERTARAAGADTTPFEGMVVAQGNKSNGYGIYILDNRMHYQINQDGKSYAIITPQSLPLKFSFKAGLRKDGTMSLFIDNKKVGSAKTAGLFTKDLESPVRVGSETENDKVGEYPDSSFLLRSNLSAKLETLEGVTPTAAKVV